MTNRTNCYLDLFSSLFSFGGMTFDYMNALICQWGPVFDVWRLLECL